jgi:hypothetical protein
MIKKTYSGYTMNKINAITNLNNMRVVTVTSTTTIRNVKDRDQSVQTSRKVRQTPDAGKYVTRNTCM